MAFGGRYDRVEDIEQCGVRHGLDLRLSVLNGPKEAFAAITDPAAGFDAGEMSISFYMTQRSKLGPDSPLTALPVWISRAFRHGNVYVRADSGVKDFADLRGARIGLAEYGMTMAVWLRGVFADEHGLRPEDIEWYTGRDPAALEDDTVRYPQGVRIRAADRSSSLAEQLARGRLDAVIGATNSPMLPGTRRLLPDFAASEREYYGRTGIFPIMHLLVVRTQLLADDPGLARRIAAAFEDAKAEAMRRLWSASVPKVTLPWLLAAVEEHVALMGEDYWPYGVAANLPTLEALRRYMREQGLIWDDLPLGDYFDGGVE
ncbi:ABC transporter substrate-binding protein [Streptomyces sp. NPDC057137]|uniref:ABC transporter substrate-binding protein n=1 Tax=Streptomyces sp. NPDC057137 TaxID=3346030 RepID=UPI00363069C0